MPITKRRRMVTISIIVLAAVVGGIAALVTFLGRGEVISSYQVTARLSDDGLQVIEVIDYDFGIVDRRGIFRNVPDLVPGSVSVSSDTAPDDLLITEGFTSTEIRIGNPDITINGPHRYRISYMLDRSAVLRGGFFAWDTVGSEWDVNINNLSITVISAQQFVSSDCQQGQPFDADTCDLDTSQPGALILDVDQLESSDGITISGTLGAPVESSPSATVSEPFVNSDNNNPIGIGLTALGAVAVAGLVAQFANRRAGRERVQAGGAADAAFADASEGRATVLMDEEAMGELATTEFEPPRDMSAVEAGVLVTETVEDHHLLAWILESAIRGEIEIDDDGDDPVLRWGTASATPQIRPTLATMLGQSGAVELGSYNKEFSQGWNDLRSDISRWTLSAPHWDHAGRRRRVTVQAVGTALGVLGFGGVIWFALQAARSGEIMAVGLAALAAGVGIGLSLSAYELLVRTELGSALWIRIESFRRFLANSEARHVEAAAERGVLRQYTAWAVALGETKAWSEAVDTAAANTPSLQQSAASDKKIAGSNRTPQG